MNLRYRDKLNKRKFLAKFNFALVINIQLSLQRSSTETRNECKNGNRSQQLN